MPPAFPAISSVIDSFNRADEGPPMTGWTDIVSGLKIVGNQCAGHNVGNNFGLHLTFNATRGDCDLFLTVSVKPPNGEGIVLYGRVHDPTVDGYAMSVVSDAGTDVWAVYRIDNGVSTQLGASAVQEISAGDKIGLRCLGSSIEAWYFNGTIWTQLIQRTDTAYDPALDWTTAIAIIGATARVDDLSGGPIPVSAELSGTALAGIGEADIQAGGKTIIITLNGDRFIP